MRLNEAYEKAGIRDVTTKIYDKSRHALLQDLDRVKVFNDIYDWIEVVRIAMKEDK